jgi:ribonucleoside-diphosphate reductase beta chain
VAGCGEVHAGTGHLTRIALAAQWDDAAVDLTADAAAWPGLPAAQRAAIGALVAGFWVAEHAVAEHLAPFAGAAPDAASAALLSLQQADEARHARFFARIAGEVYGSELPAARPALVRLFGEELPAAASALARGETELADAVGLYHLVLEGLVLGIGQDALLDLLADGALPGVCDGIAHVQRDERWHVGFGVSCLVALGGTPPPAERLVELALDAWGPEVATLERLEKTRRLHARRLSETTPRRASV